MTEQTRKRDLPTWIGLAAIGLVAIVWSFTALADLARLVGVTSTVTTPWGWTLHVAWGLPLVVDILALVATRVWLRGLGPDAAVGYARKAAWGAIVATVAGNAYHGLLAGDGRIDGVIVSAIPALGIGIVVHLAVLVTGREQNDETSADEPLDVADEPDEDRTPDLDARKIPDSATDSQIIGDLREWADARRESGRPVPILQEVRDAYGLGYTRARRLMPYAGLPAPDAAGGEPVRVAS